MSHKTKVFLAAIDGKSKALILGSIARHYDKTPEEIYEEITSDEAEHLLDYMVEPHRRAASVLMQRHGMR